MATEPKIKVEGLSKVMEEMKLGHKGSLAGSCVFNFSVLICFFFNKILKL